jgi:hypothetical protein
MEITFPKKIKANDYVYVRATFSPEERADPNNAWYNFNARVCDVLGNNTTQDNTVGQVVETDHIRDHGYCVGGVNLYGMKVRPINARLAEINQ